MAAPGVWGLPGDAEGKEWFLKIYPDFYVCKNHWTNGGTHPQPDLISNNGETAVEIGSLNCRIDNHDHIVGTVQLAVGKHKEIVLNRINSMFKKYPSLKQAWWVPTQGINRGSIWVYFLRGENGKVNEIVIWELKKSKPITSDVKITFKTFGEQA